MYNVQRVHYENTNCPKGTIPLVFDVAIQEPWTHCAILVKFKWSPITNQKQTNPHYF